MTRETPTLNTLKKALKSGAKLYYSVTTMTELAGLIEANRFKILKSTHENKTGTTITKKEYRYNYPAERDSVLKKNEGHIFGTGQHCQLA